MAPPKYLPATYTDEHMILATQPDLAQVGNEVLLQAAGQAEAEINAHLGALYALPLPGAYPVLTSIATDLAIYRIYTTRLFSSAPRPTEAPWLDRYKAAIALLLRISSGQMALIDIGGIVLPPAPSVPGQSGAAWSSTMNYVPTMGEGDDRTFRVDPNKTEAESSRRA